MISNKSVGWVFCLFFGAVGQAFANQCLSYFPDPAASHSSSGGIAFSSNSKLVGSDGIIDIAILSDASDNSCDTQSCVASGNTTALLNLPSFQNSTSSSDVTVALNQSETMQQVDLDNLTLQQNARIEVLGQDGTVRVDSLSLATNASMTLSSGVYYINQLVLGANSRIDVKPNHKAILYVKHIDAEQNASLNARGSPEQLVLTSYGGMQFHDNVQINAFLYALAEVSWQANGRLNGALNAASILLGANTQIIYRVATIEQANFNGACGENAVLPLPVAHYSMNMCTPPPENNGIIDRISGNNADALGGINVDYAGKYCQSAELDGLNDVIDIQDSSVFNLQQGTLSLWIKPRNLAHRRQPYSGKIGIFSKDTIESNIQDKWTLLMGASGSLDLRYRGNRDTTIITAAVITEDNWHFISATWGPLGIYLYVDGKLVGSDASNTVSRMRANGLDMALGANTLKFRLSSNANRNGQLKDYYVGSIDELKLFDSQLNAAQQARLYTLAAQTCVDCSNAPTIVSRYTADVCSVDSNKLVDVIAGHDGLLSRGTSIEPVSRYCQGLVFSGNLSYARIPHARDFELANGAVALWFKVDDLGHFSEPRNGGNTLFSKDRKNYGNGGHTDVRVDDQGRIEVRHQTSNSDNTFNTGSSRVTANRWNHLVYSFGGEGVQLYLNGSLAYVDKSFTTGWDTNQADLVMGAATRVLDQSGAFETMIHDLFKGEMDNLHIYRNQPSASDVANWFAQANYPCNQCTSLVAHYTFDSNAISGNMVEDMSGNGNSGQFHQDLSLVLPSSNKSCRALRTLDDRANNEFKNFDTGVDINDFGNQGGVSFWYRSNTAWAEQRGKVLIDATRGNKYFLLRLLANGRFYVGMEDINDRDVQVETKPLNFAADEWVHIAFSWNFDARFFTIIVNGTQLIRSNWNTKFKDISALGTLVFGDNKSTYFANNGSDGFFDDIRIYRQVVSQAQAQQDMDDVSACVSTLAYRIEHPETALACGSPSVTLKACAREDCSELSSDPTTLQLFPADAFEQSQVTFTGSAQIKLKHATPGLLSFGSSGQSPVAPVDCSPDCTIEYAQAGLEFFHVGTNDTTFTDKPFIAQASFAQLGLRAKGSNGEQCEALVSAAQTVSLSYQCAADAAYPYVGGGCAVPFAGVPLGGDGPHSGDIELVFDEQGEASFAGLSFADVGLLNLRASARINGADVQPTSTQIKVVPERFELSISAPAKPTAGKEFALQVSAIGARSGVLPSYTSHKLQMSAQRLQPLDALARDSAFELSPQDWVQTSPTITYTGIQNLKVSAGKLSSASALFEEVGSYQLRFQDSDYMGSIIDSNALSVGPVIPAYFDVRVPAGAQAQLAPAAGAFTYVGQAFGFRPSREPIVEVSAYNAKGQITNNYAGTLWQLNPTLASVNTLISYQDTSVYSGALQTLSKAQSVHVSQTDIYDGLGRIRLSQPSLSYLKIARPSGNDASPFEAELKIHYDAAFLTDAEGVCYQRSYPSGCDDFNVSSISGTPLRYGRLFLENSFGPENRPLRMQAKIQYLINGMWQTNTADNSTVLALSQALGHINILHDAQSAVDISAGISGVTANSIVNAGHSQVNDFVFQPVIQSGKAQMGSFFVFLSPLSSAGDWAQYLNVDWDSDGDIDSADTPSAAITFGLYRGNDKTIHWREAF